MRRRRAARRPMASCRVACVNTIASNAGGWGGVRGRERQSQEITALGKEQAGVVPPTILLMHAEQIAYDLRTRIAS